MLIRVLAWGLLGISMSVRADVNCPAIWDRSVRNDTYFVLTFVGSASAAGNNSDKRVSKRVQLESNVTPRLQDFVYRIAKPLSSAAPNIVLLTCDFPMRTSDLDREDLKSLSDRNVLATMWSGNEEGKASTVYVSIPHYQQRNGQRRDVEVAWLRIGSSVDDIEDWSKELSRGSVAHQAMMSLAVGFAAAKKGDWELAKLSFCQARSDLKLISREAVRPPPSELQRDMDRLVKEAIDHVDDSANKRGRNLDSVPPIKLACSL